MKRAATMVLMGAGLWVATQGGCLPRERGAGVAAEASLLTSLQAYTLGDSVVFVLQVTNTAGSPVELTFPTGQRYDFAVREGDREVWRWSADRGFTQAVRRERIAAGETLRYEASWTPPAAVQGELTAVGTLTASGARVEQATRFELP